AGRSQMIPAQANGSFQDVLLGCNLHCRPAVNPEVGKFGVRFGGSEATFGKSALGKKGERTAR
ncbi:MAG: hypothetical protein ACK5PB_19005, partial [Pirellula sp.]